MLMNAWHWLAIAGVFIALELITGTFFFLAWAIAALMVAGGNVLLPRLALALQLQGFAVLALLATVLWWFWYRRRRRPNQEAQRLSSLGRKLIGRVGTLRTPVDADGKALAEIDGMMWVVHCAQPLDSNAPVRVVHFESAELQVEAHAPQP